MTLFGRLEILFFVGVLTLLTPLMGTYLSNLFSGNKTFMHPALGWLEKLTYKISNVDQNAEMTWREYAKSVFLFNLLGFIALFCLLVLQKEFPLNPQNFPNVSWPLAWNIAISFVTNTNWQSYAGETTLSYLSQMLGLTVQNFLSAATGMAVLQALIRGFTRKTTELIGNFWVDIVRFSIYILLPLSFIFSLVLIEEGVVQTLNPYVQAETLENLKQTIPLGPVASQIAIKQLGTNGGGFFNANSAHPFENPTSLTNFLQALALLLIPAGTVYAYGIQVGSKRHGWLLYTVMLALWALGLVISILAERVHNPILNVFPIYEGIETRFGITNSLIWSVSTTASANGSVNAMLSSLSPLAGGTALFNLMVGELIYGGVGVGLCSMIMFILLTVFLSGLMVGRTPEYLGKKIEKQEIQWVMAAVLMPGILILVGSGLSSVLPIALSSTLHQGPHGLSEILYAFSSSAANNGSSFAGLNANTNYYNITLGVVMLLARIFILLPSLAIAGLLAKKRIVPSSEGTFSINTTLFAILLASVILIVGALTFFPALSLGPILEHLLMIEGRKF